MGIAFELREYDVHPDDLSAQSVAAKIGLPPEQVFKTLVVRGDRNGICLAVAPANAELDLKALARLTSDRKIEVVPLKEVQALTGYIRGGVTALGTKKNFPVYLDEAARRHDAISISGGKRGVHILLRSADYIRATKAVVGSFSRLKS